MTISNKSKMKKIYIALVAIIFLAAGCNKTPATHSQTQPITTTEKNINKAVTMDADGGSETPESMTKEKAVYESIKSSEPSEVTMNKSGEYLDYSPETLKSELAEGHKVVLFFHAPWCPFCKAADAAFRAKLDQIPANVVVLKTDYDSNTALKQKYGVTYQHTFVQVDNSGKLIKKWRGGTTLVEVVGQVQK